MAVENEVKDDADVGASATVGSSSESKSDTDLGDTEATSAKTTIVAQLAEEVAVLEALNWVLSEAEAKSTNVPKAVVKTQLPETEPDLHAPEKHESNYENVLQRAAARFIDHVLSNGMNAALLAMIVDDEQAPVRVEEAVLVPKPAIEEAGVRVGNLARHMSRERAKTGVMHYVRERKPTETIQFDDQEEVQFSVLAQFPRQEPAEDDMEDDLYFDTGAIIDVLQEGVEGWGDEWAIGHVAGTVATTCGFFPLNFARRLTEEEQEAESDRIAADHILRSQRGGFD
jgi:hypothetical protein